MKDSYANLVEARKGLHALKEKGYAETQARFFKTGPGEYAEGDQFIGIRVPAMREWAKLTDKLTLEDVSQLLHSPLHEERFGALLALIRRFEKSSEKYQQKIYEFYLENTASINNWDLVDASAAPIVGQWLLKRSKAPLRRLVKSNLLWERRIAIVATHAFIRAGDCQETLFLSEQLLADQEDLMHKAVGWMLREAGKVQEQAVCEFVAKHLRMMPRTMLRYAIERWPEAERKRVLES